MLFCTSPLKPLFCSLELKECCFGFDFKRDSSPQDQTKKKRKEKKCILSLLAVLLFIHLLCFGAGFRVLEMSAFTQIQWKCIALGKNTFEKLNSDVSSHKS